MIKHRDVLTQHNMPDSEGFFGEKKVKVLQDTGCSSAAVRSSLVSDTQLTGDVHLCVLIDRTARKFPIARDCCFPPVSRVGSKFGEVISDPESEF